METAVKSYTLTKYPTLFEHTYWGRTVDTVLPDEAFIIDNRNTFVTDYDILQNLPLEFLFKHTLLDHCEFYKTKSGAFVYLASPYILSDPNYIEKFFETLGFKQYRPMYKSNAVTYLRKFDNLKDYKKFKARMKTQPNI